jgi:hypothetical protein
MGAPAKSFRMALGALIIIAVTTEAQRTQSKEEFIDQAPSGREQGRGNREQKKELAPDLGFKPRSL